MFGHLFKQKEQTGANIKVQARALYAAALEKTREENFYIKGGVPDTFDGRFELLLIHIFLILHRLMDQDKSKNLSQALFDVTFKDMDQTLREMGIGDMGVPKHMRRMMKAFNGRMYNYEMALSPERLDGIYPLEMKKTTLREALMRNLYGTLPEENLPTQEQIDFIENYMLENLSFEYDRFVEREKKGDE